MEKNVKEEIRKALESKVSRYFGCALTDATEKQIYNSVILTVRDILTNKNPLKQDAVCQPVVCLFCHGHPSFHPDSFKNCSI